MQTNGVFKCLAACTTCVPFALGPLYSSTAHLHVEKLFSQEIRFSGSARETETGMSIFQIGMMAKTMFYRASVLSDI